VPDYFQVSIPFYLKGIEPDMHFFSYQKRK